MRRPDPEYEWEDEQVAAAAAEAAAIGGRAGDEGLEPSRRPLIEAGEGEAEGFELAEEDLISAAETPGGDLRRTIRPSPPEAGPAGLTPGGPCHGEADHVRSSETVDGEW
jgi:hypothetical protein